MNVAFGLALVVFSILANGFFAGVETGFTSARRVRLVHWARQGRRGAAAAAELARDRESAIVAAVVGNNVAVVAGTSIATAVAVAVLGAPGEMVAAVAMAALNIVFGEILPKTAFRARPETLLVISTPVIRVTNVVLTPLRWAAVGAARFVLWMLRVRADDDSGALSRDSLLRSFALSREHEHLADRENRLLRRFVHNSHRSIADVLTPMDAVAHLRPDATVRDAMDVVRATGHSRLPVVATDGAVRGIVLFRDLQVMKMDDLAVLKMRDAVRLSARMGLDGGIGVLAERHAGLGIVVDDGGQAIGIVTLEDLLEPLLGDITDEHDPTGSTRTL